MQSGRINVPIIDGHVDLVYEIMRTDSASFRALREGPVTLSNLRKGNIRVIVSALYCRDFYNGPATASAYLETVLRYTDNALGALKFIRTPEDLQSCYQSGSEIGTIFLIENADALVDTGTAEFRKRSIKVIGLTHSGKNRIGDGSDVAYPEGLTRVGKNVVKKLDREGFAIDVAHLSEPCFRDVVDLFQGPLISSHTGIRPLCPHRRNLDEEQLQLLFEKKGLVGISANPEMLSTDTISGIEDVFKHIDWIVQKYGADCVGLGSDFCGFVGHVEGLEDISRLSDLVEIFIRHGYPADAILKIMGANWYFFYSSLFSKSRHPALTRK